MHWQKKYGDHKTHKTTSISSFAVAILYLVNSFFTFFSIFRIVFLDFETEEVEKRNSLALESPKKFLPSSPNQVKKMTSEIWKCKELPCVT